MCHRRGIPVAVQHSHPRIRQHHRPKAPRDYWKDFGKEAYFVNPPSKLSGPTGHGWLCLFRNWGHQKAKRMLTRRQSRMRCAPGIKLALVACIRAFGCADSPNPLTSEDNCPPSPTHGQFRFFPVTP